MANYLLERLLGRSCFDSEERLMVQFLFEPTPWLVELWQEEITLQCDIIAWCNEEIGRRSNPLRGRPGEWRISELKDRTWIGFRTRRQMLAFKKHRKFIQKAYAKFPVHRSKKIPPRQELAGLSV